MGEHGGKSAILGVTEWMTPFEDSTNLFLFLLGDGMVLDHGFTHSLVLKLGLGLKVNSSKERVTGRVHKE